MRTHLAWALSETDPLAATQTVVRGHLDLFDAQMRHVLDAAPEDFQTDLERVLTRWEADRPAAVADAILLEAITHVRTQ